jgi:hypothetical protein
LSEKGVVELDDERKAAMVSNLMVVLCGERDTQPVVNAGSLYHVKFLPNDATRGATAVALIAIFVTISWMKTDGGWCWGDGD